MTVIISVYFLFLFKEEKFSGGVISTFWNVMKSFVFIFRLNMMFSNVCRDVNPG